MRYEIEYSSAARKAIERLPLPIQRRVASRIEQLRVDPRSTGSIKLEDSTDYRVRVGDYRIIYTIFDDRFVVVIIDVGHRREVYRRR